MFKETCSWWWWWGWWWGGGFFFLIVPETCDVQQNLFTYMHKVDVWVSVSHGAVVSLLSLLDLIHDIIRSDSTVVGLEGEDLVGR